MLTRPIVRILYDDNGNKISTPYDLDLTKELTVFISDIIEI